MNIKNTYTFGDLVYIKTDPEQFQRIVTALVIKPTGILYELSCGETTSYHYEFEITGDKDILM